MPIGVEPSNSGGSSVAYAKGSFEVDFGAFPGTEVVSQAVADAGLAADSVVNAWIVGTATVDHSVDEALVDGPTLIVTDRVVGVGFTVLADASNRPGGTLYGKYAVSWMRI